MFKKKYGDENFNNRLKAKEFCLKKYNVDNVSKVKSVQEKRKDTFIKRYNVINPSQLEAVKTKKEQTCLMHYGVSNPMLVTEISQDVVNKGYLTRKKNGTFNGKGKIIIYNKEVSCSRAEEYGYKRLHDRFGQVEFQYKSEDYPFVCDFYIPSEKLYIEFQITWEHCFEPFIGSQLQLEKLRILKEKEKHSKRYLNAIDIWTKKDPYKREIAKKNNLNWIEFFTLKEFDKWIEQK